MHDISAVGCASLLGVNFDYSDRIFYYFILEVCVLTTIPQLVQ